VGADVLRARIVPTADESWERYVLNHAAARPFHHPAWSAAVAEAYGLEPHAIVLERDEGVVAGGLPVIATRSRYGRARWVSLPFTDECPPLLDDGVPAPVAIAALESLQRECGVRSVEIRGQLDGIAEGRSVRGVVHVLRLSSAEELWASFRPQIRRNVRKAEQAGLTVREAVRREDLTRVFFGLHVETRHRLGAPCQPRRFFDSIWRHVIAPGYGFVLLVYRDALPVAGGVFLAWNGTVVYKYGASDRRHWSLRPNNLMFWRSMVMSCDLGARSLDLGRSDLEDTGLRAFKSGWGAEELPLVYTSLGGSARTSTARAARFVRPVIRTAPAWVGRALGTVLYRFAA
jgi:CelD/BcsL family acetyltransferase involved in cellulose biosynthesis